MRKHVLSLVVLAATLSCHSNSPRSVLSGMCASGEIVERSNARERAFWGANAAELCSLRCQPQVTLDDDNCTILFLCSGSVPRTVVGVLRPLAPDDASDCRRSKRLFVEMFVDYGSDAPFRRARPP